MKFNTLIFSILIAFLTQNNTLAKTLAKFPVLSVITTITTTTKTTTTTTASPLDLQLHAGNIVGLNIRNYYLISILNILAVWNGNYAGVVAAIKAGANVNSVGTSHGSFDPASSLIDRKLFYN